LLADDVLVDLFGPGPFAAGEACRRTHRVDLVPSTTGRLRATVTGDHERARTVQVALDVRGTSIGVDDECSCPDGGGCAHVVAVLLTFRDPDGEAAGAAWRDALAGLADDPTAAAGSPLALEVVVEHRAASRFGRARTVLAVRPLRRSGNGRWVRGGASWREVLTPYTAELLDASPAQRRSLQDLAATNTAGGTRRDNQPQPIDDFGPAFWFNLARAQDAGVTVVGDGGVEGQVSVAPIPAEVRLDLTAGPDGDVAVAVVLEIDGAPVRSAGAEIVVVGSPAHGVAVLDDDRVRLAPLAAPLHPNLAALLGETPLQVPAADATEFLERYQPALDRLVPTTSSDGSIAVQRATFERLGLVVARHTVDTAALTWAVLYRRGDRTVTHPLDGPRRAERDRRAETAAVDALALPPDVPPGLVDATGRPVDTVVVGAAAVAVLTEVVPWLLARGVAVDIVGDAPALRRADSAPALTFAVTDAPADRPVSDRADDAADEDHDHAPDLPGTPRNDWFDLSVTVTVDDEPVPFVLLFEALHRRDTTLVLPTGTWLRLDHPELDRLRDLIDEARGLAEPDGDHAARLSRFQAGWFTELEALGVVRTQSARWRAAVAALADLERPAPVAVPAGLDATLRPYQQDGLDWLAYLHGAGLGGILADDMGLGKTLQGIALCLHVVERTPDARVLVVAPTSVVDNWRRELERFAPTLRVVTIRESSARREDDLATTIGDAQVVVTSYALLRLDADELASRRWEVVFLDEAQFVKNHQSKTYRSARRLDARSTVAITGTPLENSVMDLWSLLSITAPGLFPDPTRFAQTYRKPIEVDRNPEALAVLRRRIAPLLRRRTKGEVLADLPPKIEQTIEIDLSPEHRRIYETQLQRERLKVLGLVEDARERRFAIFASLTLLRQLALDPALIDLDHDPIGSAKLDRLVEDLLQVTAEGHRALVFSQFTRFLARVRTRLDAAGIDHAYLDGRTRDRDAEIARFKEGGAPVFVISLKAGGFGLNLAEADYCFVLDPWWNPAVETQAVDRAHRIGQQNQVVVYRYVSTGTIEEKVMALKARKAALFDQVVDADNLSRGPLGDDDLRGLLDLP
jgi:superfamily II DNA or RNA helicase